MKIITRQKKTVTPMLMLKSPSVMPERLLTKLRYCDYGLLLNGAAGAKEDAVFSGNSAFDPDVTYVGHQPNGYDELASIYNRYRVHSTQITVRFNNQGANPAAAGAVIWLYPSQTATPAGQVVSSMEQKYSKWRLSGNITDTNSVVLKSRLSTAKMLGYQNVEESDELQALVNANPAHRWYWIVGAAAMDAGTQLNLFAAYEIDYYVEFFDRIQLGVS